jgi:hypothetical protein
MTAMMIDGGKRVAAGGTRFQWHMTPDLIARNRFADVEVLNGATGMSDMAGKAARVGVEPSGSERDTMERLGRAIRQLPDREAAVRKMGIDRIQSLRRSAFVEPTARQVNR